MARSDKQPKPAVVLLSGGLDSATVGAIATAQGFGVHALTFDYGQRHRAELDAAKRVAHALAVAKQHRVKIDLRAFGGSALTSDIDVPKDRQLTDGVDQPIPITYVPARNTIFLSYALALAEVLASTDIFIGANAIDYSGYPDCRPQYLQAFQRMANLATKAAVQGQPITIHAPLIDLTKPQIIQRGLALGVDFGLTHSCYNPGSRAQACGRCDSCLIRKRAFDQLGLADPALGDAQP